MPCKACREQRQVFLSLVTKISLLLAAISWPSRGMILLLLEPGPKLSLSFTPLSTISPDQGSRTSLYRSGKGDGISFILAGDKINDNIEQVGSVLARVGFTLGKCSQIESMSWKELSRATLLKTLPNLVGAGPTLRQSANWRALFVGFPPLARPLHLETALTEKEAFLRVLCRRCLQGM